MKKQWTAYDEDAGKFVNLTDPEFVPLTNGQKPSWERMQILASCYTE